MLEHLSFPALLGSVGTAPGAEVSCRKGQTKLSSPLLLSAGGEDSSGIQQQIKSSSLPLSSQLFFVLLLLFWKGEKKQLP